VSIVVYVLPCVAFGLMYGQLVARGTAAWGRDVGRYTAVNTLGSCAGILFFTLVGYEVPLSLAAACIAASLLAVGLLEVGTRAGAALATAAAVAAIGWGWSLPWTETDGIREYWGRDGVVEVDVEGNVYIDGLWHTRLSEATDPVGRPYTWLMAFAAAMAHEDAHPDRALVVGAGVGVSGMALAGIEGLEIDGYEINHTLKRVLRDYPEETNHSLTHPRMRWIWRDARTGLALDTTRYDILLSAPLYLRQAGSSLLLSEEYLRLAKSRLAPGGVLAVYSNEDEAAQSRLVQRTIARVFAYRVTWYEGLVTIAADHPIALTPERFAERMQLPDRLYRQARGLDASLRDDGGLLAWYDGDRYANELATRWITDDAPLVEYPALAERWAGGAP
jgi:spermidine synthase